MKDYLEKYRSFQWKICRNISKYPFWFLSLLKKNINAVLRLWDLLPFEAALWLVSPPLCQTWYWASFCLARITLFFYISRPLCSDSLVTTLIAPLFSSHILTHCARFIKHDHDKIYMFYDSACMWTQNRTVAEGSNSNLWCVPSEETA